MDKSPSKAVTILIPEQLALASVFYFGQVFVFCRLINKNVFEWFLLLEHTQDDLEAFSVERLRLRIFD